MKKRSLFFKMGLVCLLWCFASATNAQEVQLQTSISPQEARALAQKELPNVLQWLEPEDLSEYGFSLKDDFSSIIVGRPFYLTEIDVVKAMQLSANEGVEIKKMMLPLILDKTVRCFIYLSHQDGTWQAVGIGDRGYTINNETIFNHSDDQASLIVSVPQMTEDFVIDRSRRVPTYRPLLHVNADITKENYTLNELVVMFERELEKLNGMRD